MTKRAFVLAVILSLGGGTLLRTLWLRADPPVGRDGVDIVWHDEGAWVHNARNRALWGAWRTDNWNPVFIAPVFTALEYASFEAFGVGTWQARAVPVASGLVAIAFLMIGLHALAGRRAAAIGGVLLATNYVFVMWNRAALMESTMTAFMVVAWACYSRAGRHPAWAAAAGAAAVLAFFTKAAAAFFIGAIGLDALGMLVLGWNDRTWRRAGSWTLAGLAAAAIVVLALFVLPEWSEYSFYNWQMTVVRKPSYAIGDFINRISYLPLGHGLFTRVWLALACASVAIAGIIARGREAKPGERLLVLWIVVGLVELIVHDSGNGRRYVMFVPALIALTAVLLASDRPVLPIATAAIPLRLRLLVTPLLLLLGFVAIGALIRPLFVDGLALPGGYKMPVRLAAAGSVALTALLLVRWAAITGRLSRTAPPVWLTGVIVAMAIWWNGMSFSQWATHRTDVNYEASIAVGRSLAAGTLVQGKLANGLSLENRIRPLFVGNGFGNYADRFDRDDARYILTYDLPTLGYESSDGSGLIKEILDHYPKRAIVATFGVDETPGEDRAVLVDKFAHARD